MCTHVSPLTQAQVVQSASNQTIGSLGALQISFLNVCCHPISLQALTLIGLAIQTTYLEACRTKPNDATQLLSWLLGVSCDSSAVHVDLAMQWSHDPHNTGIYRQYIQSYQMQTSSYLRIYMRCYIMQIQFSTMPAVPAVHVNLVC